jgi:TPR repeat protein
MSSRPRNTAVLLALLAAAAFPGCGPSAVGEVVRPAAPTAGQALGEVNVACRPGVTEAEPLVVDLPSSARLDLEVAMKDGVAIVSYDCRSMKLLKGCKLPGSYRFAGVSRKEEVLKLEDQNEIAANLPFSGVQLGGGMEQGSSLDLALVFVGKKSTLVDGAARPDLEGRCDGATHFVRAASVGAFALDVGTRGEARAVAEFFGAGASAKSASKRRSMNRDGDLTECRKSTPDDAQPPGQCGSAIRLELLPILASRPAEEKKPNDKESPKPLVAACPAGMSMSNGKCTADMDAPFLCQPEDEAQCDAQCNKGSAESCYNLGVIWQKAPSEVKPDLSWEEIEAYHRKRNERYRGVFLKACDGGVAQGCDRLAFVLMSLKAPNTEVDDAWQRACNLGHGPACSLFAGRFLYSAERRDVKRGRALLDRGCRLGQAHSCLQLADTYLTPVDGAKPTTEDVVQGLAVLKDACTSQQSSCSKLGVLYTEGKVVPKNEAMGLSYYEQSCALGNQMACAEAGMMVLVGKGASKDPARAEALFEKACPTAEAKSTCGSLAGVFREGKLVPKDAKRAAGYLERSCASSGIGCMDLADMLLAGEGVARDRDRAIKLYEGICGRGGPSGCLKQAALLEATDKARARAIYGETCKASSLVEACEKFKKLGGDPKSLTP